MGRAKQSPGESIDLSRLRELLRNLLRDLWPDAKHFPGWPFDIAAARSHLGGLDREADRLLQALSSRLDVLAGKMGISSELLHLEAALRDAFLRARRGGLDRATIEKAIAEQLDATFREQGR